MWLSGIVVTKARSVQSSSAKKRRKKWGIIISDFLEEVQMAYMAYRRSFCAGGLVSADGMLIACRCHFACGKGRVHVFVVCFSLTFLLCFPVTYNEDAFILQVIEAYCNSTKTRHTVNSCKCRSPSSSSCLSFSLLANIYKGRWPANWWILQFFFFSCSFFFFPFQRTLLSTCLLFYFWVFFCVF